MDYRGERIAGSGSVFLLLLNEKDTEETMKLEGKDRLLHTWNYQGKARAGLAIKNDFNIYIFEPHAWKGHYVGGITGRAGGHRRCQERALTGSIGFVSALPLFWVNEMYYLQIIRHPSRSALDVQSDFRGWVLRRHPPLS